MRVEKQLYFLAIVPPDPLYSYALKQKHYFAEHHNSKAALKSPPHVTLHMPFRLKEKKEDELIDKLEKLGSGITSFELQTEGYGQFHEKVVHIEVSKTDELQFLFEQIRRCMKVNFNQFNADYKNRGYNPHLTVAFRDLKRDEFKRAWPLFREEKAHFPFEVKSFSILKHNGKSWDVHKDISLNNLV